MSGCTKLRNKIETQRTKRNETKYYETQRNILKCEMKRNKTKYTETAKLLVFWEKIIHAQLLNVADATGFHICKQKTIDNCTWNLSLKFIEVRDQGKENVLY
jgi:hypothetical protein